MRQVFSSLRLENVEGIAKFLEDNGIEVRITHGRSYKGGWGGRRPYREGESGPLPAVWVVKSEDQPKARLLLREAGLLDTTRGGSDSYLAPSVHEGKVEVSPTPAPQKRAFRYKIALLIAIVVAVGLAWNASRKTSTPQAPAVAHAPAAAAHAPVAPAAPTTAAPAEPVPGAYPVETPPILGTTLAATELEAHEAKVACLRIDGVPASDEVLAQLKKPPSLKIVCANTSDPRTLDLDVRNWRTDGSGTGTVELAVTSADADGRPSTQVRTLLVRRIEADWHVLRVLDVH
jgi:hypothetical protein